MSKATLQEAQAKYDDLTDQMREAERAGNFELAIRLAKQAWQFVDDMMKFEKRYEGGTFRSVPCIELVLRYAPLLLDKGSLIELANLLKEKRSIDRNATVNLAERVDQSLSKLMSVYRLWQHIEHHPLARQDELREQLGGNQADWRALSEQMCAVGLFTRAPSGTSYALSIATSLGESVRGKCSGCGARVRATKWELLGSQKCPGCEQLCVFCIIPADATAAQGVNDRTTS